MFVVSGPPSAVVPLGTVVYPPETISMLLVARCDDGTGAKDAAVTDAGDTVVDAGPMPPRAPIGIQASEGTSTAHVSLDWEPVSDATSYDIYRDGVLLAADLIGTTFDDTGAQPGGAPNAAPPPSSPPTAREPTPCS